MLRLAEEDLAGSLVHRRVVSRRDREASLHGGPCAERGDPALDVGELGQVDPLPFGEEHPGHVRNVGYRVGIAGKVR
jgi:hypothetical protein